MLSFPTALDSWIAHGVARLWGHSEYFDLFVEKGIEYGLLGGVWFALGLFLLWAGENESTLDAVRRRMLTTLAGTALAAVLVILSGPLVNWQPPNRTPGLAERFPDYLDTNPNESSFPSQSAAIYAVIAMGAFSVRRRLGTLLWAATVVAGAAPRMYMGGHYLTDVLAGLGIALVSYATARRLFEGRGATSVQRWASGSSLRSAVLHAAVFFWIFEVGTSFKLVFWLLASMRELV